MLPRPILLVAALASLTVRAGNWWDFNPTHIITVKNHTSEKFRLDATFYFYNPGGKKVNPDPVKAEMKPVQQDLLPGKTFSTTLKVSYQVFSDNYPNTCEACPCIAVVDGNGQKAWVAFTKETPPVQFSSEGFGRYLNFERTTNTLEIWDSRPVQDVH